MPNLKVGSKVTATFAVLRKAALVYLEPAAAAGADKT